ncbi:branched-chain amino acid transport system substrate-binding protein [Paenibacillus sp. yr247]|uniref:branched-chain amino acid ABC transporter substrate-binding protein n=1 Tax=Paenibacillus sp. yr247 TaxID=1761880 RepID=UPI0008809C7D|nr:branched-chain amino acid ABC transporter substrate-binding protein [Paenibacillus sp. yr247]SDO78246.1 branched-chain amino acid transport system substrate-binding protein [Paenibacillus sp. yr247]
MNLKKKALLISASALAIGLLAGCGSGSTNTSTTTSTSTAAAVPAKSGGAKTVIKIATQSPLSGGSAVQGEAIKLGAQQSLEDHKAEFDKLGFDLQLVPYDDQGDPKKGVANAEIIGADPTILGIVGHMNSGVAIPSSVVYEKYNAVMVSPSNTATEVTDRNLKVVNRIVARDDFQGPAAAEYAVKTVKAKNIFVIQDKTAYGQGLAEAFKDAATKLGATISGYEGITVGEKDFNGVLNIALNKKPDFIFFGGLYAEGGLLIKQARAKGITVPMMGADGWDSQGLVDTAGDKVKDALYASISTDITKTAEGKKWADQYKAKFGKGPDGYSAYAYDCMSVILEGIKSAAAANGGKVPTRDKVRDAVRSTKDFQGVATKISFDGKGDNTYAKVFIYKFEGPTYPGTMISEVSK